MTDLPTLRRLLPLPPVVIPSRWLQGAMRSGKPLAEAVEHWIEQGRLQEQFDKERSHATR